MSKVAEIEALQLQIEELHMQLHTLRIGETVNVPSRQMKDISLVTGIPEWTGEVKGKTLHELFFFFFFFFFFFTNRISSEG